MSTIDNIVNFYLEKEGLDEQIQCLLSEAPKGWDEESVKKFAKTIGMESAKDTGFFEACVTRMKKHEMKDPEGFCADLKDIAWGTTMWRGKGKTKKEIEAQKKEEK